MRLIDVDALVGDLPKVNIDNYSTINKVGPIVDFVCLMAKQPTVDAVPVVRCKDCKHSTMTADKQLAKYCDMYIDEYGNKAECYFDSDFFCANGERKHKTTEGKQV